MGASTTGGLSVDQAVIPIRNLYFLLCYSWDQLEQGELLDVSRCPTTDLVDLFALVLCSGINHLARRGLEQGYKVCASELASPRGRIDALASARRFLPTHGRAACEFDELTVNTLNNQILKSALETIRRCKELAPSLRGPVAAAFRSLQGIDSVTLTAEAFRRVQLHSNTRFYRFLLNVCELIYQSALPDQRSGTVRFRDFVRDERAMARVFEQFLFNFLRRELTSATVKRDRIPWLAWSESDPELTLLPCMNTDISVYGRHDRLIIDAKYYRNTLSLYRDATKFHSANLYQLMSYLTNASRDYVGSTHGMLIYPRVDRTLRERYSIQGHRVTVATVNLASDWPMLSSEIIELVGSALAPETTACAAL